MDSKINLLCQLLNCGHMDLDFLINLCDKNRVDLDIDDIKSNYGEININNLIYEAIRTIAEKFIEENRLIIQQILQTNDLYDYMSYKDIYEIFVNFLDSHLYFSHDEVQRLFERSSYSV